jgi:hypothetical protein
LQEASHDQVTVVDPVSVSLSAVGVVENIVAPAHQNRAVVVRIKVIPRERDVSGFVDGMCKGVGRARNVDRRVGASIVKSTFRKSAQAYFWVGFPAGAGAGAAGCVFTGADFTPCSTEFGPLCFVA